MARSASVVVGDLSMTASVIMAASSMAAWASLMGVPVTSKSLAMMQQVEPQGTLMKSVGWAVVRSAMR